MGKMIGAAEFKAKCLSIMREVERSGEAVTVTQHGRPMVEIKPAFIPPKQKLFFGCMKGTMRILHEEDDLVDRAYDQPWSAEKGVWEPEE
jgi:prevent-host-death family protein